MDRKAGRGELIGRRLLVAARGFQPDGRHLQLPQPALEALQPGRAVCDTKGLGRRMEMDVQSVLRNVDANAPGFC